MTYHEYEKLPGIRVHELMDVLKSPARYLYNKQNPSPTTPAMRLGTLVHRAVLEPAVFVNTVRQMPEGLDRRTKEGKAVHESLLSEMDPGGEIVSADDFAKITGMRNEIMQHPAAGELIRSSATEMSHQWNLAGGRMAKGRADAVHSFASILAEIKTTRLATPDAFIRSVLAMDYDMQAAWYSDGWQRERFVFIAVESTAPYLVACYELDEVAMARGRQRYHEALAILDACEQSGNWPGYSGDIETLSLPAWAFDRIEDAEVADGE